MTKQANLISYVFDGQPHLLSGMLAEWLEASSRFTDFVKTNRDKIRKKIRLSHEAESVLDLRSELEVAFCLLSDRRLAVSYEPYASAKRRGPDFSVTFRANLVFNVEVARIRGEESGAAVHRALGLARIEERLQRVLLDKLGQMQPGMVNLLVVHTREELARSIALGRFMQAVKTRADKKEPAFYAASHYPNPAAFYKDFLRFSGILLWAGAPASMPPALWINRQARPGLEGKVLRIVTSALEGCMPSSGAGTPTRA